MSSSKCTKHIKAKYFLIKDYYNAGEVDLRYRPMGEMWADVLTKPLQGQLFRDMRAFLQNCSRDYDDDLERQEDERAHHMMKQQVASVTRVILIFFCAWRTPGVRPVCPRCAPGVRQAWRRWLSRFSLVS